MAIIHQLSDEVIAKIAAGEVIERPAYALKELIENSVDAKATHIKISLERAGLDSMSISDNGSGMEEEDILECFKPHTTSKIDSDSDLYTINSMGFRGEALASLAAISAMTIRSRQHSAPLGTEIELENSKIISKKIYGMPAGTEIIIKNLFYSVPARKKFINNPSHEFRLILEMITGLFLALPSIGLQLTHNKRKVLDLPVNQSLPERILSLLGNDLQYTLLPVAAEDNYVTLSGYIAKPQTATTSGTKQYLFVNRRKVSDKNISTLIKTAYGSLLEARSHPVFILFIDIPAERVDVNIHPRKEQIAFSEPLLVHHTIKSSVVETLAKEDLIYNDRRWQKGEYSPPQYQKWSFHEGNTQSYAGQLLKEFTTPWAVQPETLKSSDILQMHNVYLVTQTATGILLIDQHAAHERILYEQFLVEFQKVKNEKKVYKLETPLPLPLSVSEYQMLKDSAGHLEQLGFSFDEAWTHITAVPEIFVDRNSVELIKEVVTDLRENNEVKEIDVQTNKMLAYLACRTAIKAGDPLSKEEAQNLLEKLSRCTVKFTCPHGRPTQIEFSLNQLHHLFHRR